MNGLEAALADIQFARQSHLDWAEHLEGARRQRRTLRAVRQSPQRGPVLMAIGSTCTIVDGVTTVTRHGQQRRAEVATLPRCYTCRHWDQDPACPEVGRCDAITVLEQRQLVHTEASFGCVNWKAQR